MTISDIAKKEKIAYLQELNKSRQHGDRQDKVNW